MVKRLRRLLGVRCATLTEARCGALDVLEGEELGHARNVVAALLVPDACAVRNRLISPKSDCGVTWKASWRSALARRRLSCSTNCPTLL